MAREKGLYRRTNKPGGVWYMRIRLPNGETHRESCDTTDKATAALHRAARMKDIHNETFNLGAKKVCNLSLEEVIRDHYFKSESSLGKSFVKNDKIWLNYFMKVYTEMSKTPIAYIDAPKLTAWKVERTRRDENDKTPHRVKKISVNKNLSYLMGVFKYAVIQKFIEKSANPFLEVTKWELLKYEQIRELKLEQHELDTLFQCCINRSQMLAEMVVIYLSMGMRNKEVAGLRREQLKFELGERGMILIDRQKNGEIEYHPMTGPVRDILLKRYAMKEHPSLIFPGPTGIPYSFWGMWQKVRRDAKMEKVRIHDLRHACAYRLRDRGADIQTIMEFMRHKTLGQTQRYIPKKNMRLLNEASKMMDDITIMTQSNNENEKSQFDSIVRQLE